MTPVILLSDGFIANGAEPWKLPRIEDLPEIRVSFRREAEGFQPYSRDAKTLARPWAIPGTPGLEHRVGGLEKADGTGDVSYDPANHERMVHVRAEKVERVADDIPLAEPTGDTEGDLLVVGWGSTYGSITSAVRRARAQGMRVSQLHLRYLNPLPRNLGEVLDRYERVLVPEINLGQLSLLLQGRFLKPVIGFNRVRGLPFQAAEVLDKIVEVLERK
jgi:2-oxoglutarate ferredoxin oxidoreductase subunit alpha